MANLTELLNAFKNEKAGGAKATPIGNGGRTMPKASEPQYISEDIDNLDNMVFGKPSGEINTGVYSPEREMEMIKSGYNGRQMNKSMVPAEILNEFVNNPIDTSALAVDTEVDAFANRLGGVQRSADILTKLEENDKKKAAEKGISMQQTSSPAVASVDYGLIKTIIEKVIDEKLSNFSMLNESIGRGNTPSLMIIKQTSDGQTMFIDSDNNIFECKMIPKGKAKFTKK